MGWGVLNVSCYAEAKSIIICLSSKSNFKKYDRVFFFVILNVFGTLNTPEFWQIDL